MPARLALLALVASVSLPAVAEAKSGPKLIAKKKLKSSRSLCEKKWPKQKKPAKKTTDRCLQYWLYTYAYSHPSDDPGTSIEDLLSYDPSSVASAKYTAEQFLAMKAHVEAAYPSAADRDWPVLRAIELFERSAGSYTSFFDMNCDVVGSLSEILNGNELTSCPLEAAESATLWLLRNAAYARHGRKFKHPDLNHYFYGEWNRPSEAASLSLPRSVNPKFKDRMLTKRDRATVRAIAAEENKRKRKR